MLKQTPRRTVFSATTGGEILYLCRSFMPEIRLVTEDGEPAEIYYRIQSDGEGVLVVKPASWPQLADPETNSGCFDTGTPATPNVEITGP